jgi:hypothetical protein
MGKSSRKGQYTARKLAGLCVKCGKTFPATGRVSCLRCLRKATKAQLKQADKMRRAGKCPRCGGRGRDGFTVCKRCQDLGYVRQVAIRTDRKSKKLCLQCGAIAISDKSYCARCKERDRARGGDRKARLKSLGLCSSCGQAPPRKDFATCELCRERGRGYVHHVKVAIIEKYGGRCVCCSESNLYFLTIDHVNNDGASEKRQLGNSSAIVRKVYREPRSSAYQLLCFNCNCAKGFFGSCPHTWPNGERIINGASSSTVYNPAVSDSVERSSDTSMGL